MLRVWILKPSTPSRNQLCVAILYLPFAWTSPFHHPKLCIICWGWRVRRAGTICSARWCLCNCLFYCAVCRARAINRGSKGYRGIGLDCWPRWRIPLSVMLLPEPLLAPACPTGQFFAPKYPGPTSKRTKQRRKKNGPRRMQTKK